MTIGFRGVTTITIFIFHFLGPRSKQKCRRRTIGRRYRRYFGIGRHGRATCKYRRHIDNYPVSVQVLTGEEGVSSSTRRQFLRDLDGFNALVGPRFGASVIPDVPPVGLVIDDDVSVRESPEAVAAARKYKAVGDEGLETADPLRGLASESIRVRTTILRAASRTSFVEVLNVRLGAA
jgi:hypothetical protein